MRDDTLAVQHYVPLSFAEVARILGRNAWQIVGVCAAVVTASLLYVSTETPLYKATTVLLIEPRANRVINLREAYDPGIDTDGYFATQIEIIRSRQLAQKVVQRDRLADVGLAAMNVPDSRFDWRQLLPERVLRILGQQKAEAAASAPDPEARERAAIRALVAGTLVEPVPRTQLIRVSFISSSAEEAARLSNAIAEAYIESGLESRLEASRRATVWLTTKLSELRGTLESAEKSLQEFREREQLVNVGGARALVEEELVDGTRRLREAQKVSNALAATYRLIQDAGSDASKLEQIGDLIRLTLVQNAKTAVVAAEDNLEQLLQRYGAKHPQIAGARARLDAAQKTFKDQLLLAAENIRGEYELAKQNESVLSASVAAARDRIQNLDRKQYEFGVLQREVSSNEQLYNMFLSGFKETDTSSSFEPINARILQQAETPTEPFSPDFRGTAIKGAFAGLALALLLVWLRQLLDESVRSAEELELAADLSVLGVLPQVGRLGGRRNLANFFVQESRTAYAEGIRGIKANIQLNDTDRRYRRILVTSTVPGEGKSSLSACLALAFAANERVLLLEGDMRAPTQKKLFGVPKTRPGLMEVLGGETRLEDAVFVHESSKLSVLAVGRRPANPSEVVSSSALQQFLTSVAQSYDRIIIDSPPLQAASDGLVLAKLADAVVFTVKADDTRRRAVINAVKQLRNIQASPLGAVINQVSARRNPSYGDLYYAKGYYG
jgi:polysaccharide biosynthesis transport protein